MMPFPLLKFTILQKYPEVQAAVFIKGSPSNPKEIWSQFAPSVYPVILHQVHGSSVIKASSTTKEGLDGDALITSEKNVGLTIRHADCQSAIFFDPIKKVLGNVHAGWRGSVENIYKKTIDRLKIDYGTDPKDLIVCIGPSLGPNHAQFIHYRQELPPSFWKYQVHPDYFDFWKISRDQLTEEGVLPSHIEIMELDTFQDLLRFHSYRRDKTDERMVTCCFLALN